MKSVAPFLMFEGEASSALDFYMSVFTDARIDHIERYTGSDGGPEGTVKLARFTIAGQTLLCSDSYVSHAFTFTPSLSLFIECESEAELNRLSDALKEGGAELMPANDYGFSKIFAWVSDRYGVSWQLNCA